MSLWIEHTTPLLLLLIGEKDAQAALWERAKQDATRWRDLVLKKAGGGAQSDIESYFQFKEPFYLGMGAYGIVLRAVDRATKKDVALKLIPRAYVRNSEALHSAENEVTALLYIYYMNDNKCNAELICYRKHFKALVGASMLKRLAKIDEYLMTKPDGRGLPEFDDTDWDLPQYFIATQLYASTSLETLMGNTKLPGTRAKSLAWNLSMMTSAVGALEYMHANKLYHRDVKPANVLVQGDTSPLPTVVLIDVGESCEASHCEVKEFKGTPAYFPPGEYAMFRKNAVGANLRYDYARPLAAFDVYALGATFYDWMKNTTTETPLQRGVSSVNIGETADLWTLIRRMIEPDDKKRITAHEAHKEFMQLLSISWPYMPQRRASTELKIIPMG